MTSKHYGEFEVLDYSGTRNSTRFYTGAITALTIAAFLAQFGALRTALGNIVLGTVSRERWVGDENILSNIPPTNHQATRKLRWHVHYVDTFKAFDHDAEIATPDVSLLSPVYQDQANFASAEIQAFVTAFEDIVRVQIQGLDYPVVIEHMYLVGHVGKNRK